MNNLEKEIREQPSVLRGIREVNEASLHELAGKALSSDITNIYFAARGTSDHAAIYAQYLLGIYAGIPSSLATPSVITAYGGKLKLGRSLVMGVSQSGKAADVLEVVRQGKECGALTASVTNDPQSPLAREADFHLYCAAGQENSIAATKTFTSQMYLLALLCSELSGSAELAEGLTKIPDALDDLLSYMPYKLEEIAGRCRYLTSGVVLARGTSYPIALEGALKILETNRVKMKGYSISDFYHGPLAQIYENDLAIVLAAEGPMLGDALAMIDRLNEIGAEVVVVGDSDEALRRADFALPVPKLGSDALSPFLFAVTLQLFALKLAEVKRIDPDASKVLKKVTITK